MNGMYALPVSAMSMSQYQRSRAESKKTSCPATLTRLRRGARRGVAGGSPDGGTAAGTAARAGFRTGSVAAGEQRIAAPAVTYGRRRAGGSNCEEARASKISDPRQLRRSR